MGDTFEKRKREQRKRMKRKEKKMRRQDRGVIKQAAQDRGEEMIETMTLEEAFGEPIFTDPEAVVDLDDLSADTRAREGR